MCLRCVTIATLAALVRGMPIAVANRFVILLLTCIRLAIGLTALAAPMIRVPLAVVLRFVIMSLDAVYTSSFAGGLITTFAAPMIGVLFAVTSRFIISLLTFGGLLLDLLLAALMLRVPVTVASRFLFLSLTLLGLTLLGLTLLGLVLFGLTFL